MSYYKGTLKGSLFKILTPFWNGAFKRDLIWVLIRDLTYLMIPPIVSYNKRSVISFYIARKDEIKIKIM